MENKTVVRSITTRFLLQISPAADIDTGQCSV